MSAFRLAVSEFSSPGTLARASSSWLGGLLGGWRKGSPLETKIETEQEEEHPKVSIPAEQVLENIAVQHNPSLNRATWRQASLGDAQLKGEILCSFENTFNHRVPNQKLSSITTFSDLLELLESASTEQNTAAAVKIFPNIVDDGTLPPNLSIQFISTELKARPRRRAFQNFDAQHPEHANFLSKQERERRKQKRRHLTVWKK